MVLMARLLGLKIDKVVGYAQIALDLYQRV